MAEQKSKRERGGYKSKSKSGKKHKHGIFLDEHEYNQLIETNLLLKQQVKDLKEVVRAKDTGHITEKMKRSIRYKVGRYTLRVQANNSAEDVVKMIDRAADDIIAFISNFDRADDKDTFVGGVLYVNED